MKGVTHCYLGSDSTKDNEQNKHDRRINARASQQRAKDVTGRRKASQGNDRTGHDTTRYDTTRYDTKRYETIRYDTIRNETTAAATVIACRLSTMDHSEQPMFDTEVGSLDDHHREQHYSDGSSSGPSQCRAQSESNAMNDDLALTQFPDSNASDEDHANATTSATISTDDASLPLLLQLLFGLNGLSLSLLTLPIMYILNTRVKVPLPYLPAYGAIAFLPYSLKPMYAYLCGWLIPSPAESPSLSSRRRAGGHRYLGLFGALLTANSLCTIGFCAIPEGGVAALFAVAFCRGIADSWAEFCLGLTLINRARESSLGSHSTYETVVSGLQARAATAGNLGAWLASVVTCLIFVRRYYHSHSASGGGDGDEPQLSGGVANGLIAATAFLQLLAAIAVVLFIKTETLASGIYREISTDSTEQLSTLGDPMALRSRSRSPSHSSECPTELDSLRGDDEESSHPSYSSLEDFADDEDSLTSNDSIRASSNSNPNANTSTSTSHKDRCSPATLFRWILVVLLQFVLVLIALKEPIVESSSHFVWSVSVTTLAFGCLLALLALWCGNHGGSGSGSGRGSDDSRTLRVGLYLVLRNAVPSDTTILASFAYSLLGESRPVTLQLLAVLGMGVNSLSSWSYTKFFSARFGGGRPLLCLMGGTVVLASMASLLNVAVIREYQHSGDGEEAEYGASAISARLLLLVVVSKIVTTFFGEWAFLPELVLATTSVGLPRTETEQAPAERSGGERTLLAGGADEEVELGPMSAGSSPSLETRDEDSRRSSDSGNHNDNDNNNDNNAPHSEKNRDHDKRIAVEYGTLVSCIDFGDQLGSLAAAPLVALLNISRDNDFLHLDRLILVCAVANMVVTIGLLPLLAVGKSKHRQR